MDHLQVPVDVAHADANELADAHAGVEKEPHDGHVAAILERVAFARGQESRQFLVGQNRHRLLRDGRNCHALHRGAGDLALLDEPPKQLLQRAVVFAVVAGLTRSRRSAK